jgi:protein TonB
MNTIKTCDRFEREGILSIERGLSLDTHFDTCTECDVARHKYEALIGALPLSQPDVLPPPAWQSRVLRAAADSDSARPGISMAGWRRPFASAVLAGVGALAAAAFLGEPPAAQFEVQAETHTVATLPELAIDETTEQVTGEDELTKPQPLPSPVAPKTLPKQTAPMAQATTAKPQEMPTSSRVPAKPAPAGTNTLGNSDAIAQAKAQKQSAAATLQVTRPNKLYGLAIKYPSSAMKAKIQGETSVQCTIRADGRNTNCRILKGLPYLDSAVIQAVEAARSEPIRVNGKPVDHSDHIWHITITLREILDDRTSARGLPILNWER